MKKGIETVRFPESVKIEAAWRLICLFCSDGLQGNLSISDDGKLDL